MKFTLSWLKTHLDGDASLEEICDALTDLGLEVEDVRDPASALKGFTLARVEEARAHPEADRLRICDVRTSEGKLQIICGAPNAKTGMMAVLARAGMHIPGTDMVIEKSKIRGETSEGMLCSEREMGLSDEHDGIIEIEDVGDKHIGEEFVDYLARTRPDAIDPVIEIAITPNRPDALGVRGIARDLAARRIGRLKEQDIETIKGSFPSLISVEIDKECLPDCPVFYGRLIRNVKNAPSPEWLQTRLRAIGLRPISTLVDITNFMTFDQNRPLHVFDADKLAGGLRIHHAEGGEKLTGLDEKEYEFAKGMVLISDDSGPVSMGGVMGGLSTGCTEATKNVFLEAAYFDPIRTARTGRMLKINSDARYRFERGIDPEFTPGGLDMATALILDICGGEASEAVMAGEIPEFSREYRFDPAKTKALIGMDIAPKEQKEILKSLGFALENEKASPPSWRPDIGGEADLIEEIVRVKSLGALNAAPLERPRPGATRPILTLRQNRQSRIRRALANAGLNECVTYSFIAKNAAQAFGGGGEEMLLANPISSEMSHLRPSLYAGLLEAAKRNIARGFGDLGLFELGEGFGGPEPEDQFSLASALLIGAKEERNAFATRRDVDIYDAKAILEHLMRALGHDPGKLSLIPHDAPWFHPARAAKLGLGPKNIIAEFGELHPKVTRQFDIRATTIALSLFYERLPEPKDKAGKTSAKRARPPLIVSDFQSVSRDFAFIVEANRTADELIKTVRASDKKLIDEVILFDVFEGPKAEAQFGAGMKSLAVSVTITPEKATLTEAEINALSETIITRAKEKLGATLRG